MVVMVDGIGMFSFLHPENVCAPNVATFEGNVTVSSLSNPSNALFEMYAVSSLPLQF